MTDGLELPRALATIAGGAAEAHTARQASGAGLALGQIHTAARRRRLAFGTGVGLVAVALVGAVALGGAAAGGLLDRDPVPPVHTPDAPELGLPAVPVEHGLPQCGSDFEPPVGGTSSIRVTADLAPTDYTTPFGGTHSVVDADLGVSDIAASGTRALADGGPRAFITRDGVVVDIAVDGTLDGGATDTTDEPMPLAGGAPVETSQSLLGSCAGASLGTANGLADGAYEVWAFLTLTDGSTLVAGPWPLELSATVWMAVDPSALPSGVPIVDGRMVRAEQRADGLQWRVDVEVDDGGTTYDGAVALLTGAGFGVDGEETDPARPAWRRAELSDAAYAVTVELSNETGGGAFVSYVITVVAGDAEPGDTAAPARLPGCGESTETLEATTGPVLGTASVKVGLLSDVTTGDFLHEGYGDTLWVDTALTNVGPDLTEARPLVTEMVVAAGGEVVVTWQAALGEPSPAGWPSGETRTSVGIVTTTRCAGDDILRHGEYTLWVRTTVEGVAEPEGGDDESGRVSSSSVVYQPVDFWVYDFEDPENHGPVTWTSSGQVG